MKWEPLTPPAQTHTDQCRYDSIVATVCHRSLTATYTVTSRGTPHGMTSQHSRMLSCEATEQDNAQPKRLQRGTIGDYFLKKQTLYVRDNGKDVLTRKTPLSNPKMPYKLLAVPENKRLGQTSAHWPGHEVAQSQSSREVAGTLVNRLRAIAYCEFLHETFFPAI